MAYPFLSRTSVEAELSQPTWRCRGGCSLQRPGNCVGGTEHLLREASAPCPGGAEGAKWCICWCQVWASQPRKESPKIASPPPLPPAPAAVNGSDLEGGHVGQKLSSRACRLRCLLSWLQGKAVVLPSPPRCWTTVLWAQDSEAGVGGWLPGRWHPSTGMSSPKG